MSVYADSVASIVWACVEMIIKAQKYFVLLAICSIGFVNMPSDAQAARLSESQSNFNEKEATANAPSPLLTGTLGLIVLASGLYFRRNKTIKN